MGVVYALVCTSACFGEQLEAGGHQVYCSVTLHHTPDRQDLLPNLEMGWQP